MSQGSQGSQEGDELRLMGTPCDVLIQHGLNKADLEKLAAAGLVTCEMLAYSSKKQIMSIKGISEAKADKIVAAVGEYVDMGFLPATVHLERRSELIYITTGSKALDNILGGGIETGSSTEMYGEYRTGKTQLCHTLAVTCQLPASMGGGEGKCLWIDTEGTFRAERIAQIATRFGLDSDGVMENICVATAHTTDHQLSLLSDASVLMSQSRFSLVLIDSLINLYRAEFPGRGELAARQNHLSKMLSELRRLSDAYGVAVVYTNQIMSTPDAAAFGPSLKAAGGHIVSHASHTRISFRKGRGTDRIAKIVDSPSLPESEAVFAITVGGINDAVNADDE